MLIDKVVPQILELARQHQKGRGTENVPDVPTFDFTEGWFRTSGLYDLLPQYQLKLMENFLADKCKWNKEKVQKEAAKYKQWQEFVKIIPSYFP